MTDFSPLFTSLKVTAISTVAVFFLGIFAAHYVAKLGKVSKGILDSLLTLPMILPPTVVGFFLLKIFGVNGLVGKLFMELLHAKIVFTWQAAAISSAVVAFPLMYRTVLGAFEQFDSTLVYSAKTLGRSNTYIFWHVILPNNRYGILAGTVLAFARGLGEFGATIMLAGNIPGKTQTISTAVYSAMAAGNDALAYKWVFVNLAISVTVMMIMNFMNRAGHNTAQKPALS